MSGTVSGNTLAVSAIFSCDDHKIHLCVVWVTLLASEDEASVPYWKAIVKLGILLCRVMAKSSQEDAPQAIGRHSAISIAATGLRPRSQLRRRTSPPAPVTLVSTRLRVSRRNARSGDFNRRMLE